MALEKIVFAMKTWKDKVSGNTPVTAAELNRIEKGISDCAKQTNALGDSVCQIKKSTGTTSATIEIGGGGEVVLHVMSATKHTSINFYASQIMVYDEIERKRIATYAKTS